jgi:hypothetical protein
MIVLIEGLVNDAVKKAGLMRSSLQIDPYAQLIYCMF